MALAKGLDMVLGDTSHAGSSDVIQVLDPVHEKEKTTTKDDTLE